MENDIFKMNIVVPANCYATVHIPAGEYSEITESGEPAAKRTDFKTGSGKYCFEAEYISK